MRGETEELIHMYFRRLVILTSLLLMGCYRDGNRALRITKIPAKEDTTPVEDSTATPTASREHLLRGSVVGTVMLGSRAVTRFGVTLTSNYLSTFHPPAVAVESRDGTFALTNLEDGTFDLIISGPSFARRVVPGITIVNGQTTTIGTIHVIPGIDIRGRVVDENLNPVPGIAVRIEKAIHDIRTTDDEYTQRARGSYRALTDASGTYLIKNVHTTSAGDRQVIFAATDGIHASGALRLPNISSNIDLTVKPVGVVTGRVVASGNVADDIRVTIQPQTSGFTSSTTSCDPTGEFTFRNVPAGAYEIVLRTDPVQSKSISVTANQVSTVDFLLP